MPRNPNPSRSTKMDNSEDFYDGLLSGLFWFFWPTKLWQWLLYAVLVIGLTVLKNQAHEKEQAAKPAAASSW